MTPPNPQHIAAAWATSARTLAGLLAEAHAELALARTQLAEAQEALATSEAHHQDALVRIAELTGEVVPISDAPPQAGA